jgi:hypothetical protein
MGRGTAVSAGLWMGFGGVIALLVRTSYEGSHG